MASGKLKLYDIVSITECPFQILLTVCSLRTLEHKEEVSRLHNPLTPILFSTPSAPSSENPAMF